MFLDNVFVWKAITQCGPCFRRRVKLLVPKWSGREDPNFVLWKVCWNHIRNVIKRDKDNEFLCFTDVIILLACLLTDDRPDTSTKDAAVVPRYDDVDIVFIGYSYGCSVELSKCIAIAAITMSCDRRYF